MATQDRLPTGEGANDTWTAVGAGGAWDCCDDPIGTPDDATTYIKRVDDANYQLFTYTAFAISDVASVEKVTVTFRGQRTAAGALNIQPVIRVNGGNYSGAAQAMTTSWANYSVDWTTNPDGGGPWSEADVEGTSLKPLQQFGVIPDGIAAGEEAQVTQCYITVTYTESVVALTQAVSDNINA